MLAYLEEVEHRYLFLGGTGGRAPDGGIPAWATVVDTWAQFVTLLRSA